MGTTSGMNSFRLTKVAAPEMRIRVAPVSSPAPPAAGQSIGARSG
jgi:hypothetical protein